MKENKGKGVAADEVTQSEDRDIAQLVLLSRLQRNSSFQPRRRKGRRCPRGWTQVIFLAVEVTRSKRLTP